MHHYASQTHPSIQHVNRDTSLNVSRPVIHPVRQRGNTGYKQHDLAIVNTPISSHDKLG